MTKLWDYHEISGKFETFCGRPQVAPTNKFENQQLDKSEFIELVISKPLILQGFSLIAYSDLMQFPLFFPL